MTITQSNIESITESDLQEFVDDSVPEGLFLDYKATEYGKGDDKINELLKDVSAFANVQGGHIILGMSEKKGVANRMIGLNEGINVDKEMLRMEQIIRNGLEPSLQVRMTAVALTGDNKAIVVRVPRSWNAPHRVSRNGTNKFYIRHSTGVHEGSMQELKALFNQAPNALSEAKTFRDERIKSINEGEGIQSLVEGAKFVVHVVPLATFSNTISVDLKEIHSNYQSFYPLIQSGCQREYNYYGFINKDSVGIGGGYTQVFRNGCIEAVIADSTGLQPDSVYPTILEEMIFACPGSTGNNAKLYQYITGLQKAGVPAPLAIMFSLVDVKGKECDVGGSNSYRSTKHILPESTLMLPICLMESYGDYKDFCRVIKPAFDALWNAAGRSGCESFNDEGVWERG